MLQGMRQGLRMVEHLLAMHFHTQANQRFTQFLA